MYKRILLAYDGSDAGQNALLDTLDLAQWSGSELALIAVMPSAMSFVGLKGGVYDIELEEREKKKYRAVLDEGLRRLSAAGYPATGELVAGEAIDEICKYSSKIKADLIVMTSHRPAMRTYFLGSNAGHVVRYAKCSVLVVRH